jgi:leucyl aminopeptidase
MRMSAPPSSSITFLPLDLNRWDSGPGGDAVVVPVWADIRPLRGAAGLLDWRLCGRLSQMIRDGRVAGSPNEKLLLSSSRVPWKRILAIGLGETADFSEETYRETIVCILKALHGIGASTAAIALPGRDIDRIPAEHALREFASALATNQQENGTWLKAATIIDAPSAIKAMAEVVRTLEAAAPSAIDTVT